MLKYLSLLMFGIVGFGLCGSMRHPSEQWIRGRAIQLHTDKGSCSGEQVEAPSGHMYVLTAGHCRSLLTLDGVRLTDASGKDYTPKLVAEDTRSDLLLLRGVPKLQGLKIAKEVMQQEHIRTFTHGAAYATYKTEGEMIQNVPVDIPLFQVNSEEDSKQCNMPKLRVETIPSFFGEVTVCLLSVKESVGTAMITPGSSGGMVVNDSGELVGVVSAGDSSKPIFGYYVRLKDIARFLKKY